MDNSKKKNSTPLKALVQFFMRNRFSKNKEEKVQRWLIEAEKEEEKNEALREEFEELNFKADDDVRRSLESVNKKLGIVKDIPKKISLAGYSLRVAAVLLPVLIAGGGLYLFHDNKPVDDHSHYVEVTVPYGEHDVKHLACGSNVWVNSGSTLKYRDGETIAERHVDLSGEAYFTVEKINEKPFVVHTDHLTVKVMGTKFNIEAYSEEQKTVITLDRGSIEVETEKHQFFTLKPNQQFIFFHTTGKGIIKELPAGLASDVSGWKNWNLSFDEATLAEIIHKLEKRFNIKMVVEDMSLLTDEIYTVQFTKEDKIENVMEILENMVENLSYRITDNKIIIKQID